MNRKEFIILAETDEGCWDAPGRILNVAVCPADTNEPPRVLNYLTAPHVYIWSAVSCSSAFPLLFAPQDLVARNQQGLDVTCALSPCPL